MRVSARAWLRPGILVGIAIAACWPAWAWYADRMVRTPEHRAALVPLALAIGSALLRKRADATVPASGETVFAASLLSYAVAFPLAPPIVRALFAFIVLCAALAAGSGARAPRPGVLMLLGLALPLLPSAQFFAGYPMRAVCGGIAAWMLSCAGFDVTRIGAMLAWDGGVVAIDAPCSGIKMTWSALLVAAAIAAARDLGWRRTAALALVAGIAVIGGNALRTAALFFSEAEVVLLPSWGHDAVGVIAFAAVAAPIVLASRTRFFEEVRCSAAG